MRVIPAEMLKTALYEAIFEEDGNFQTDINRVIRFVKEMDEHSGFDVVRICGCWKRFYYSLGRRKYDRRMDYCFNHNDSQYSTTYTKCMFKYIKCKKYKWEVRL